ncbi:peroxiredoxin [Acetobacter orleanensis]|uniref:thioredoxin-dependent peroxiredoxin n=2 Tax=Acetobacter orleanensis TaxID=104099 RepID=A0A4Y3TGV4_9PROT|nr:thioredoxin peroxidase [Acetobacter orleanensis JCM 7639]GEB82171.1 peroxiredoxin [Acetobacter orleanensis]
MNRALTPLHRLVRIALLTPLLAGPVMMATLAAPAAHAALADGVTAPDFTLSGALGGKPITFSLKEELKKGPVVLYFFPSAFTSGCTLEAHAFAEAMPTFQKLGATVVGVTAGNIDRVSEFSKEECRSAFPVLADPGAKVARLYDSQKTQGSFVLSSRTSFVVSPEGRIVLSYTSSDPETHVQKTLEAVQVWRVAQPARKKD